MGCAQGLPNRECESGGRRIFLRVPMRSLSAYWMRWEWRNRPGEAVSPLLTDRWPDLRARGLSRNQPPDGAFDWPMDQRYCGCSAVNPAAGLEQSTAWKSIFAAEPISTDLGELRCLVSVQRPTRHATSSAIPSQISSPRPLASDSNVHAKCGPIRSADSQGVSPIGPPT